MGCLISQLAAKFAFFPPSPATYHVKKSDDVKLVAVSTTSSMPISGAPDDPCLDVLLLDTKRGNKIVAFYLKNPYARLPVLYSHGNAADLGQLYDLFIQLKANLRVNLMGYPHFFLSSFQIFCILFLLFIKIFFVLFLLIIYIYLVHKLLGFVCSSGTFFSFFIISFSKWVLFLELIND